MAQVYRIDIIKQNCWLCDHFRRNNAQDANPNIGSCRARAPKARGDVDSPGVTPPGATQEDTVGAAITAPVETYCGDYKPWPGAPRLVLPYVE